MLSWFGHGTSCCTKSFRGQKCGMKSEISMGGKKRESWGATMALLSPSETPVDSSLFIPSPTLIEGTLKYTPTIFCVPNFILDITNAMKTAAVINPWHTSPFIKQFGVSTSLGKCLQTKYSHKLFDLLNVMTVKLSSIWVLPIRIF